MELCDWEELRCSRHPSNQEIRELSHQGTQHPPLESMIDRKLHFKHPLQPSKYSSFYQFIYNLLHLPINKLKMLRLDLPVFDLPAERNVKHNCQICNQSFGVTLREHMCKRCFRAVCDDCSPFKVRSYRADLNHRLHRMCTICNVQSKFLQHYAEINRIRWGEDSDMAKLWLKQLGYKVTPRNRTSQKMKKQFAVRIQELWKSLNFSFRQFLGIAIDKAKATNGEVIETINICLSQVSSSKSSQPENQIYLLMFFLAHSSPQNAILFTRSILQLVALEEISMENITMYLSLMQCSDIESYKMENFLEQYLQLMIKRVTVNYFTADLSIQIICSLISKRTFEELEKGIAFVLVQRKAFISKHSTMGYQIMKDLVKNASSSGYRKAMREIQGANHNTNNSSYNKSQTNSTLLNDQKVEKLTRENEELKIKNKNQEDQIMRLKIQNKNYQDKQRQEAEKKASEEKLKSRKASNIFSQEGKQDYRFSMVKIELDSQSMESYYSFEEKEEVDSDVSLEQQMPARKQIRKKMKRQIRSTFQGFIYEKYFDNVLAQLVEKHKYRRKLGLTKNVKTKVKKYRPKQRRNTNLALNRMSLKKIKDQRMSTLSEKRIKTQNQLSPQKSTIQEKTQKSMQHYEEKLFTQNQQISKLKKELTLKKYEVQQSARQRTQLKDQIESEKREKEKLKSQCSELEEEKKKLSLRVKNMEEMNKKLLLKLKQLSNLLMDREEEEVSDSSKSFQELAKSYEQELKKQECAIF